MSSVFEEFFDEDGDPYGRAEGDPNIYTTGRIGKHNVVLALLCHMGKAHASSAAASIGRSYTRLRFALLVGICGGVSRVGKDGKDEILLGDVVISKSIVQYDYGRQFSHKFVRKNTAEDNPGKPNKYVRSLVTQLETDRGRWLLQKKTAHFLKELQASAESESTIILEQRRINCLNQVIVIDTISPRHVPVGRTVGHLLLSATMRSTPLVKN